MSLRVPAPTATGTASTSRRASRNTSMFSYFAYSSGSPGKTYGSTTVTPPERSALVTALPATAIVRSSATTTAGRSPKVLVNNSATWVIASAPAITALVSVDVFSARSIRSDISSSAPSGFLLSGMPQSRGPHGQARVGSGVGPVVFGPAQFVPGGRRDQPVDPVHHVAGQVLFGQRADVVGRRLAGEHQAGHHAGVQRHLDVGLQPVAHHHRVLDLGVQALHGDLKHDRVGL